jgi:hypothetical protein
VKALLQNRKYQSSWTSRNLLAMIYPFHTKPAFKCIPCFLPGSPNWRTISPVVCWH